MVAFLAAYWVETIRFVPDIDNDGLDEIIVWGYRYARTHLILGSTLNN